MGLEKYREDQKIAKYNEITREMIMSILFGCGNMSKSKIATEIMRLLEHRKYEPNIKE